MKDEKEKIKKTIMTVDDNEYLRKSIRRVLEKKGYYVLEAANTEDAWRKIQLKKPDLILLDILMYGPSSSGFFVHEIGASKEYASIKVIYVSSVENLKKSPGEKNVYGVIEKPIEIKELISKIKDVLGEKEVKRKNG